ncbi:ferrous iron transporter B, partial [Vibrio sp. 10N.222.49.E5]
LKRERQVINLKALEKELGCPVLSLSANDKGQVVRFKERLHKLLVQGVSLDPISIDYDVALEALIPSVESQFDDADVSHRALAIRALENDYLVLNGLAP